MTFLRTGCQFISFLCFPFLFLFSIRQDLSKLVSFIRTDKVYFQKCALNNEATFQGTTSEDFAVLGQFCAKIITCYLHTYTKFSCKTIRKISNAFCQGVPTIIILVSFEDVASELEKIRPIFSSFTESISILAIRSNRQQETVSVP